jgi:hypothetical protein
LKRVINKSKIKGATMRLLWKKAAAVMTLAMFLVPSSASAATIEGQVVSLDSQAPGLWKVVVKGSGGEMTLMISTKTALQKEVPVEALKAGDRLVAQGGGQGGVPGVKDPLSGMAESTKKALGLPNIPNIPQIPKIPPMPDKNQMIQGQGPAQAAPGSGGGPAGPGGPPAAGGMAPKKPAAEEPKVKTQDEMLQEKGFQNEKLLFPPKAGGTRSGAEVTQVSKTDLGFEVTVVSETGKPEKKMYAPGKKVMKVLSLQEVKKDDRVVLNFNDTDKTVLELEVKG